MGIRFALLVSAAMIAASSPSLGDGPNATGATLCRGYSAMGDSWRTGYVREALALYIKRNADVLSHRWIDSLITPEIQLKLVPSVDARCVEAPDASAVETIFATIDFVIAETMKVTEKPE